MRMIAASDTIGARTGGIDHVQGVQGEPQGVGTTKHLAPHGGRRPPLPRMATNKVPALHTRSSRNRSVECCGVKAGLHSWPHWRSACGRDCKKTALLQADWVDLCVSRRWFTLYHSPVVVLILQYQLRLWARTSAARVFRSEPARRRRRSRIACWSCQQRSHLRDVHFQT